MSEPKKEKYFFNKNVTVHVPTKEGLVKTMFNAGDACPSEIASDMVKEGHVATTKPEEKQAARIDQVKKEKLPEMSSRGGA